MRQSAPLHIINYEALSVLGPPSACVSWQLQLTLLLLEFETELQARASISMAAHMH